MKSHYKQGYQAYIEAIKQSFKQDSYLSDLLVGLNDDTRIFLSFYAVSETGMQWWWEYIEERMPERTELASVTFTPKPSGRMRISFLVNFDVTRETTP